MKYENMKNAIIAKTANIESYNESEMADLNTFLIIDIQNEIAVVAPLEISCWYTNWQAKALQMDRTIKCFLPS